MTDAQAKALNVLNTTSLYDRNNRYVGSVFQYADGCTHSIQRFGDNRRFDLGSAVADFRETAQSLPAHVFSYLMKGADLSFIRIGERVEG